MIAYWYSRLYQWYNQLIQPPICCSWHFPKRCNLYQHEMLLKIWSWCQLQISKLGLRYFPANIWRHSHFLRKSFKSTCKYASFGKQILHNISPQVSFIGFTLGKLERRQLSRSLDTIILISKLCYEVKHQACYHCLT